MNRPRSYCSPPLAALIRADTCDPRRSMNPLTGIWPACATVPGYRYASPDGEGCPATNVHCSLYIVHCSFTFSAKERDSETGLSYFGSRYYSSDLSVWLSVDPMAAKYPSLSPYVYCADNPVKLVDPDGEEVWLNGDENSKAAAFKSMQEGTHLLLTMGKDGRITAEGDPISDADYLLLDAINDNSVKVNIECNRNGDAGEYHGTTYDKINSTATSTNLVNMFEMAELEKDAPVGSGIIHEVTEGYYAGLIAIATRKSIRAASRHREEITITGANIKITGDFIPDYPMDYKKYRRAHYRATPAPNEMTPAQKNNFRSPSILYRIDQLQKKLQIL